MSKQLTLSATLSVLAMGALVFAMSMSPPERGARPAAAHGTLISVFLSA